ncbi:MAG: DEAD/DEAH box helicase family protein [Gaiellales bacterium]
MLEAGDAAISAEFVDTTGTPSFDDVQRWIGERIVAEGEPVELRRGSVWAGAYLDAVEEMAQGLKAPSPEYRRRYALPLGLERMLGADEPHLASGLPLRAHQVDALAGMLAAVIGDYERQEADEAAEADLDDAAPRLADESQAVVGDTGGDDDAEDEELVFEDDDESEAVELPPLVDEEPVARVVLAGADEDEDEDEDEDDEDATGEHEAADPGAVRRYRFKHPTASGKTVAAAAFVDAARITGVLILTHRRLLVDQFKRDLKEQGYGHRIKEPVLGVARPPVVPPISIETYAWFIKNADRLSRDTYGVILCDEAHTALGDRTSAAIRRLDTPTYIGMTATDELLQKHVGDVFPAEIADFPLGEAVLSGVVAPLRAVRVPPGASLKRVRLVGGDYDQQELADALDHDAVNMAAAMYYLDMFGQRPGIVYAAGVDHAGRVAAAMRAIGLKAEAVSGRTPPRELAETLAAYERGEVNVLVNAQLLAEGWNAPRATVCMHLAPTASRRVYQQRVGRVMRLHRRKESGVVVDFAEAAAPHTDRTITLHSLLDVDTFQPGALVTPRPPRVRRRWRRLPKALVREAPWVVPVTPDPARRAQVIRDNWKTVAVDRLPLDEQELWAAHAAERAQPKDLEKLARVLVAVPREARMVFFAKCAAENRHRQLRLEALRDLAQSGPGTNLFEQAVRLVERAPTWRQDRQQGARTLLLALGDGFGEASDHYVTAWAWRLAGASHDAQQRRVTTALENGRELVRSLAGKTGEEARAQAKAVVAIAEEQPLDVGAAILACIRTTDPAAERVLDDASIRMSADPRALAAALGSNVPLPRGVKRPTRSRVSAAALSGSALPSAIGALPNEAAHEEPKKRRRRRRKKKGNGEPQLDESGEAVVVPPSGEDTFVEAEEQPAGDQQVTTEPSDEAASESPAPKKRTRRRKVADETPAEDGPVVETSAPSSEDVGTQDAVDEDPPKPKRRRKAKTAEPTAVEEVAVEVPAEPVVEFTASGMRRVVIDDADDATFSTDGLAPKRGRSRSKPKPRARAKPKAAPQSTTDGTAAEAPAPVEPAEIPEW